MSAFIICCRRSLFPHRCSRRPVHTSNIFIAFCFLLHNFQQQQVFQHSSNLLVRPSQGCSNFFSVLLSPIHFYSPTNHHGDNLFMNVFINDAGHFVIIFTLSASYSLLFREISVAAELAFYTYKFSMCISDSVFSSPCGLLCTGTLYLLFNNFVFV